MVIGVTGANGFIGQRVTEMALNEGYKVHTLVRDKNKLASDLQTTTKVFVADLQDKDSLKPFAESCDVIIHTAALVSDWAPKSDYQKVTVGGTEHLLEWMKGGNSQKIVLASSVAVYGPMIKDGNCVESRNLVGPMGNYSWSKQAQERLVKKYHQEHQINYSIVRPGNVFGPRGGAWVDTYLEAMKKGPILINGGEHHSLCYIDHVAQLLLLAATKDEANGEIYNATDNHDISWKDYSNALATAAGVKTPSSIPLDFAERLAKISEWSYKLFRIRKRPPLTKESITFVGYPFDVPYQKASIQLGFEPFVPIDKAMENTINYVKEKYA